MPKYFVHPGPLGKKLWCVTITYHETIQQTTCFDWKGAAVSITNKCRIGISNPPVYGDCFDDMGKPVSTTPSQLTPEETNELRLIAFGQSQTMEVRPPAQKLRARIDGWLRGYKTEAPPRKRRRR